VIADPVTYGKHDEFCGSDCSFLSTEEGRPCMATCTRDGQPIMFYDWYLAHCKGQMDAAPQPQEQS